MKIEPSEFISQAMILDAVVKVTESSLSDVISIKKSARLVCVRVIFTGYSRDNTDASYQDIQRMFNYNSHATLMDRYSDWTALTLMEREFWTNQIDSALGIGYQTSGKLRGKFLLDMAEKELKSIK